MFAYAINRHVTWNTVVKLLGGSLDVGIEMDIYIWSFKIVHERKCVCVCVTAHELTK